MSSVLDLFSLKDRTALVTGGTRGIGEAMALALADAGADIVLIQRNGDDTRVKAEIEKLGRKATVYAADLSSVKEVAQLTSRVLADGHDISILVNNAGIQRRHPAHEFPDEDWTEVIQVNLNTVWTLCRDIGAYMLKRDPPPVNGRVHRGSIINIASLCSFQGGLTVPAYASAKGGVAQLTKALANEWASKGINVNGIAPGYIHTDMNEALINNSVRAEQILVRIPAGRWGLPEDFKGAIVYLSSRASLYVHGELLLVDGGWMGR